VSAAASRCRPGKTAGSIQRLTKKVPATYYRNTGKTESPRGALVLVDSGPGIDCHVARAFSTLPIDLAKTSDGSSTLAEWPMGELDLDLRVKANYGLLCCYPVAVKESQKPAFFCTSGCINKDHIPDVFSLSVCKAGQHNLVQSMHKKYKEQGVYCGLVVVGGVVADDHPQCNAENIANKTWALYEQRDDLQVEIVEG
jgi:hypothetical protein